jgi:hypothetical protein
MREKFISLIWGVVLILAGFLFLAQNLEWIPELPGEVWMAFFAVLSLLFFASYFISGLQNWGWLFPAFIFGGLAVTITLGEAGVASDLTAAPILLGVALPFVVIFLSKPRENWWALIPAWVMLVVTSIVLLGERVPGEFIGALVMLSIALPFLVVFVVNRANWWALIPAFVLFSVAVIILLSSTARAELIGPLVMFAIALPFLVVFLLSRNNWWALIPAGIMISIGLGLILAIGLGSDWIGTRGINGVILLGWALTFAALWLLRGTQPTGWAKYPALGFGIAGVAAFFIGVSWNVIWALLLIVGGVLVLYSTLRPRKTNA